MKDKIEDALLSDRYHDFIGGIEKIKKADNLSYMDSVICYCTDNEIEVESVASLINKNPRLKETIREEAEQLNFLTKTAKLPI